MPDERRECLATDVVLDAFGVRFCDRLRDADRNQESHNGLVTIA
jgi:hypothetical protein